MTIAYRRHSVSNPNWNRNVAFPSRTNSSFLSHSFNHRILPNSPPIGNTNTSSSHSNASTLNSEPLRLYQSTSKAMRSPSIPTVSEHPGELTEVNPSEKSNRKKPASTDQLVKGKDREFVRTRPIFHANLEEAKKYQQILLKNSTSKKVAISCEEVICRYCDHFRFQLPVFEVDRFKEGGKRRVLLRIKRRLVGIGEGRTTFQAMLSAYDDAVLYLFNDSELENKLLQPNEIIEWHRTKVANI